MYEPLNERAEEGVEENHPLRSGWSLVSVVCLIVAVPCLLTGRINAAFAIATLGVTAWFLNVRSRLKPADTDSGSESDDNESDESDDESDVGNDGNSDD